MEHLNVWENVSGIVDNYTYVFPCGAEVEVPNPQAIFRRDDRERLIICEDKSVITINSDWIYARTVFTKEYLESKKSTQDEVESTWEDVG